MKHFRYPEEVQVDSVLKTLRQHEARILRAKPEKESAKKAQQASLFEIGLVIKQIEEERYAEMA